MQNLKKKKKKQQDLRTRAVAVPLRRPVKLNFMVPRDELGGDIGGRRSVQRGFHFTADNERGAATTLASLRRIAY